MNTVLLLLLSEVSCWYSCVDMSLTRPGVYIVWLTFHVTIPFTLCWVYLDIIPEVFLFANHFSPYGIQLRHCTVQ